MSRETEHSQMVEAQKKIATNARHGHGRSGGSHPSGFLIWQDGCRAGSLLDETPSTRRRAEGAIVRPVIYSVIGQSGAWEMDKPIEGVRTRRCVDPCNTVFAIRPAVIAANAAKLVGRDSVTCNWG
jgi:hypothetical protein